MNEQEERFTDGNVSAVVRAGDTVRREIGPWTPAVHALLRHLEAVGFPYSPRLLGIDERGREILSFVPGETIPASLAGYRSDNVLVAAAELLRRYHDATATFVPPADAVWRFSRFTPPGGIICHNDFAPYNLVMLDGQITGLIDWDFATPGSRKWDIAYALWRFVPFYGDPEFGPPEERSRRMRLFCDAYGLADRNGLLDTIIQRQMASYRSLEAWAADGIEAFARMWREGHAEGVLRDVDYVERNREKLSAGLTG